MLNIKLLLSISLLGVFVLANALTTFMYKEEQTHYSTHYSTQYATPYGTINMNN